MIETFFYYKINGRESPYAVNYKEAAIQWFKNNNYKLIKYDNSGSKIVIFET